MLKSPKVEKKTNQVIDIEPVGRQIRLPKKKHTDRISSGRKRKDHQNNSKAFTYPKRMDDKNRTMKNGYPMLIR